jgi:hypothetical protein
MYISEENVFFKCPRCTTKNSIFKGQLFFNSNLEIYNIVDLVYFWSVNLLQNQTRDQINTKSHKTVGKWFRKLQEFCFAIERQIPRRKIGGIGFTIQIDESLFSKRKYNVGREVRKIWVVGGISYETKEVFCRNFVPHKCGFGGNYFGKC